MQAFEALKKSCLSKPLPKERDDMSGGQLRRFSPGAELRERSEPAERRGSGREASRGGKAPVNRASDIGATVATRLAGVDSTRRLRRAQPCTLVADRRVTAAFRQDACHM